MPKPGVIIIEGHVQGLANTRALGEQGIPVIVVDVHPCVAASSKYCQAFYTCPAFKEDAFADFLERLGQEQGLQGWLLLPSNDHAVYTLSKHKKRLSKLFKFLVPDFSELDKIYDKVSLLTIAQEQALPIPKTFCVDSFSTLSNELDSYPVLIKGRHGLTFYKTLGKKAFLLESEEELQVYCQQIVDKMPLSETFTQELIPFDGTNKTLSFTAFCVNGEIKAYWMGVKLREHPLQFGTATFTESVYEEVCLEQSKRLLTALDYTGICEVEYLKDPRDGHYKLIEINPRTWLWVGHAIASGVNLPLYAYNYVNGISCDYPNDYPIGLKWRNPISDALFSLYGIVTAKLSLVKVWQESKGRKINALWYRGDVKPFFVYGRMLFSFFKER